MATPVPPYEQIGLEFVNYYYKMFDVSDGQTRSQGLGLLYDPVNSCLTFEGAQICGKNAILEKYSNLPIRSIARLVTKTDCQPLADGSILVTTFGQLKTDDDPPQSYLHTFVLKQTPDLQSWFISNEIFRLVIHN